MNVAIDISPLKTGHFLQHRVRGTGFYIEHLRKALIEEFQNDTFVFFTRGEKTPAGVDVVHYPYFEPFFLTLPFWKRYKTVVTVHDLTPLVFEDQFPKGLKGALKWNVQKKILQNVDRIITDSDCSKKDIVRFADVPEEKVKRIYLAADSAFKPLTTEQYGYVFEKFSLPKTFALYVGDATWNKNLPRLIAASDKAGVPLVMVGKALVEESIDVTNPWNKDLAHIQKNATGNKDIIRLGFVETDDLVALYNAATVFTMPSLYEGFGLPALEALQSGCAVIVARRGSLPEVVGDAGLYVEPESIESIASGISKVINDKKLKNDLSRAAIPQAKKFSWKKTAEETMKVYEALH